MILNEFCVIVQCMLLGEPATNELDILIGGVPQILPVTHPVAVVTPTPPSTPRSAACALTYINNMVNVIGMFGVKVNVNIVLWIWL